MKIIRYVIAGGLSFVLDFGLLALMVSGFGWNAGISAAIAVVIATVFSYLAQKYFTFQSRGKIVGSAIRYLILFGWNTLFTALFVEAFDYYLDLYMVGKILCTAIITLWNYPLMNHWVYSQKDRQKKASGTPNNSESSIEEIIEGKEG